MAALAQSADPNYQLCQSKYMSTLFAHPSKIKRPKLRIFHGFNGHISFLQVQTLANIFHMEVQSCDEQHEKSVVTTSQTGPLSVGGRLQVFDLLTPHQLF